MGSWTSIADMKNDPDFRKMLKEAIKGTITQANDYRSKVTKVEEPDAKARQVATNKITTDGKKITIPARVYESDGLFLTVDAPDSEVWTAEFRFRPQSVYFGAFISLLGWLTFFYVLLFRKGVR